MKLRDFIIVFIVIWVAALTGLTLHIFNIEKKPPAHYVKLEQPEFLNEELNDSTLLKVLVYYEIKEPLIVLAQAKLESANYKSRLCKEKNNIFGLYNSKAQQYYNFDHWINGIIAYKNLVEYKHREGENYFEFLTRISYAEDSLYIYKLKSIIKNIPP